MGTRPAEWWWVVLGAAALAAAVFAARREEDGPSPAPDVGAASTAPPIARDTPDDAEVARALEVRVAEAVRRAVAWLRSRQRADGSWEPLEVRGRWVAGNRPYEHPAGPTALALYTLLECDVPPDAPQVRKGFAWLSKLWRLPNGTYETAMLLLAVCATAQPDEGAPPGSPAKLSGAMRKWTQDLVEHLRKKHQRRRGWGYQVVGRAANTWQTSGSTRDDDASDEDSSSTHLAALALLAADRRGVKVKSEIWHDILRFALGQMEQDGPEYDRAVDFSKEVHKEGDPPVKDKARGTAYRKKSPDADESRPYGSVTACGLASLQIARLVLQQRSDKRWTSDRELREAVQRAIHDSAAWLHLHWDPSRNPGHDAFHGFWPYSVEIAMDLLSASDLGGRPWYREMAGAWLDQQRDDGRWDSKSSVAPSDLLDTCWMLLFLQLSAR